MIGIAFKISLAVAESIVKEVQKDGFQTKDLIAFLHDDEFKKVITEIVTDLGLCE